MRTLVLASLLAACGSDVAPTSPPDGPPPTTTPFTECDSDPNAFIRDSFLAITGRRPLGQAEVDVYRALWTRAEEQGLDPRATVGMALTRTPEFGPRWESALMDALRVQRINVQSMQGCWGQAGDTVTPHLAQQIRDNDAGTTAPRGTSTMLDVARSALVLDDLSTVYRAQLFNLVSLPPGTANVGPVEAELAQRADLGGTFDSAWLRRDTVCLGCHNSEASVTDSDEPALDRHWPVAGSPEKAVYGVSTGVAGARAHGMFRISSFVFGGDTTPWGLSEACGQFAAPGTVPDDIAGVDTKLGSLTGKRTTVYELDAALRRGFDLLRDGPTLEAGAISDPDEALAWLVTLAITEEVWREIVGSPLTIANGFPRNRASSELLNQLATDFAASGYSLKQLVVKIVTTDFFSRRAPEAGCGAAYGYPAVFDPWTTSEVDAEERGNGPGDAIAWLAPRTMAIAASGALWNGAILAAPFPADGGTFCQGSCEDLTGFCDQFAFCCAEAQAVCAGAGPSPNADGVTFQRSVGIYLRNSEPGSRGLSFQARLAWEDRFGSCGKPDTAPADPDFIDEVLAAAAAQPDATVSDIVQAVKDRIIGEPVIQTGETPALEALLGPLTAPASGVDPTSVRHFCGVLLGSPQFTLAGLPGRDGAVPRLTPEGASAAAVCARLDGVSLGGGKSVSCATGTLAIVAQ